MCVYICFSVHASVCLCLIQYSLCVYVCVFVMCVFVGKVIYDLFKENHLNEKARERQSK